jgi:hypothetical protein
MLGTIALKFLGPLGWELRRIAEPLPQCHVADLTAARFEHCRVLANREALLASLPTGGVVAEIGVADGDFSEKILQINQPSRLLLIDSWDSERFSSGLEKVQSRFQENTRIIIKRGLSLDVLAALAPRSLDWVYLDTVHDYQTTALELIACEKAVKSNGRIAGHDFCIGNPYSRLPYGVIKAVFEFCRSSNWRFEYITLDGNGYFSFCLAR